MVKNNGNNSKEFLQKKDDEKRELKRNKNNLNQYVSFKERMKIVIDIRSFIHLIILLTELISLFFKKIPFFSFFY